MKKIFYLLLLTVPVLLMTSCADEFLTQSSTSDADQDYVLSNPAGANALLDGALDVWRDSRIHSNGLFYSLTVCSSDAERHPEKYADQERHVPENLYFGGTSGFNIDFGDPSWARAYDIIATCNIIITNYEATDRYQIWLENGVPTELSHIYGQAVALRATLYLELCRYYGDVIHQTSSVFVDTVLTSRDEIYEYQINKLETVVPLMYRVGENASAIKLSRTYVEGLIGRLCLYAGGYATRRTDLGADFYTDVDGNVISFELMGSENNGGVYNRRTDYIKFYEKAKMYLSSLVNNSGSAGLITTDPRGTGVNGEVFGNPFQYVFQTMLDLQVSPESIYEIAETQGVYSERPYAFGRPSGGGGSNAYPCKSYGQSRMQPTYYYGDFDPDDLRRDVTVAVTASVGNGRETLLSLEPGSKTNGGLGNNKWDENRMNPPWYQAQRQSGVNNPYMRMSDVILMLAEVYAELGEDGLAKAELTKVRSRAFSADKQVEKVSNYIASLSGAELKKAIMTERKLEFGGEGIRKYDMIRTGLFSDMIKDLKANLSSMINGLAGDGKYEFANGNVISSYVWTKQVDAGAILGRRLTTQTTDKNDPLLNPGWRGQYNDWEAVNTGRGALDYKDDFTTNTAIKGLFTHIDPEGAEAAALVADGYEMKKWGAWLVEYKEEYSDYVFRGFEDGVAPIYLIPINAQTIATSNGNISNGYGFGQE